MLLVHIQFVGICDPFSLCLFAMNLFNPHVICIDLRYAHTHTNTERLQAGHFTGSTAEHQGTQRKHKWKRSGRAGGGGCLTLFTAYNMLTSSPRSLLPLSWTRSGLGLEVRKLLCFWLSYLKWTWWHSFIAARKQLMTKNNSVQVDSYVWQFFPHSSYHCSHLYFPFFSSSFVDRKRRS